MTDQEGIEFVMAGMQGTQVAGGGHGGGGHGGGHHGGHGGGGHGGHGGHGFMHGGGLWGGGWGDSGDVLVFNNPDTYGAGAQGATCNSDLLAQGWRNVRLPDGSYRCVPPGTVTVSGEGRARKTTGSGCVGCAPRTGSLPEGAGVVLGLGVAGMVAALALTVGAGYLVYKIATK